MAYTDENNSSHLVIKRTGITQLPDIEINTIKYNMNHHWIFPNITSILDKHSLITP